MQKKKLFIFVLFFLFITSLSDALFANAQQAPFNITASPNSFDLKVKPDSTTSEKIRIRNNADVPVTLTLSLKKLTPDTNGDINLTDFTSHDTQKNWVTFTNSTISALPKEWTDVAFTITVPKEAAFGYYYALFISTKPNEEKTKTSSAKITGSIAIPILLFVEKDGAITNGKLLSFTANQDILEYLPVTFTTLFENTGNVHTKPQGTIFIKDWTGQTVDTVDINKQQANVLPSSKRALTSVWDNSFITYEPKTTDNTIMLDNNGKPKMEIKLHFDKILSFRIGKYSAHALVVISGEKKDIPYEASTTFWVFPWKIVLGSIIFIILAGIGLINTAKSIVKTLGKVFKR